MTVIFAESLQSQNLDIENAPKRTDGYDPKNDGISLVDDLTKDKKDISFNEINLMMFDNMPICNDTFYSSTTSKGVCRMANTNINDTVQIKTCKDIGKEKNSIGLSFLYPNYDKTGKVNDINKWEICHKEEVQPLFNAPFSSPNKMVNFVQLLGVAVVTIIITAVFGCCYEFWLKYGNAPQCIYYKSKFSNIGPEGSTANLIQYIYPNDIKYYPYQEGKTGQQGGRSRKVSISVGGGLFDDDDDKVDAINSNFKRSLSMKRKCVNVYDDDESNSESGKVFPYNVADIEIENEFLKMPLKAFSFYFLYMVLITRICFNKLLTILSRKYNENIGDSAIKVNVAFLILTGLIFNIVALIPGVGDSFAFLHAGPGMWIGLVLSIASSTMMNPSILFIISTLFTILPQNILGSWLRSRNLSPDYYRIYGTAGFKTWRGDPLLSFGQKFKNALYNFLLFFPWLIMILITMIGGLTGTIFATIYLNLSILFNTFYIPLSNTTEFMDLMANHGDLLTILFCTAIVGSSYFSEFDLVTTGTMSGILFLLIIYKLIHGFKKGAAQ